MKKGLFNVAHGVGNVGQYLKDSRPLFHPSILRKQATGVQGQKVFTVPLGQITA